MSFEGSDDGRRNDFFEDAVELPPKLAALAEQLGDDARALALRYPAQDVRKATEFPAPTYDAVMASSGLLRWSIVWGVCAATVLVAILTWRIAVQWDERNDRGRSTAVRVQPPVQVAPEDEKSGVRSSVGATLLRAENVLRGLSAAEQEAVLDLMEGSTEPSASLSI
jgi:hypothetical protein